MTIRLRLTLWYSSLLAITLVVFGVTIYLLLTWNTYADLKEQLKEQSDNIVPTGQYDFFNKLDLSVDPYRSQIEGKDMYIQLINYKEGVVRKSRNLYQQGFNMPYPEASKKLRSGFVKVNVEVDNQKYSMLTYQTPYQLQGELVGLLQVGAITYNEDKFLGGVRTILIFSSLVILLIAFTSGLFIAKQALRPIERVVRATEQIEKGSDLSMRIPSDGPKDEIGVLVNTLNVMLSRLEKAYNELDEAYKAQRRFVSDASHELRTPLTTIRGNIDLLQLMWNKANDTNSSQENEELLPAMSLEHWDMSKEAMSDIAAEAKRMSTLVGDLLALARADAGYVMEKQVLSLLTLTEEVARRAQLLPRSADWRVGDLSELESVSVYGNHEYLQQLLFILIENAFKYTPNGYIELNVVRKEGHIGLSIEDTGIGMNPNEIPHIFDRFYRADESRGVTVGTGLGLSIAKWIIDEHKGSIEVTTVEGEGTKFMIWLPIDFSESFDSTIMEHRDGNEQ